MRLAAVQYIQRDKIAGRLIFRRAFPVALRPFIPGNPRELVRTLGVKLIGEPQGLDRYNAAMAEYGRLATIAAKAFADIFDTLDTPTIAYLSETFRAESLASDEAGRWDNDDREHHTTLAMTPGISAQFKGNERQRWPIKRRETLEASEAHNASLLGRVDIVDSQMA